MPRVAHRDEMRQLLARWLAITEHDEAGRPLGHWAIEILDSGLVIGAVALLPLPPGCTDLEIGWQITPAAWGHGYGAEAGHAVAHQAFANGVSEVFAVVRLCNTRGVATARRVGMEVGRRDRQVRRPHTANLPTHRSRSALSRTHRGRAPVSTHPPLLSFSVCRVLDVRIRTLTERTIWAFNGRVHARRSA